MSETLEADYVVVGAGSAGSAIVRRLVDAGHRVRVLEAGGPDEDPYIHSPQGWPWLLTGGNDWTVMTTPQEHLGGRSIYWPRGKTLGGSSSLNGMIYMRGDRTDYDGWAEAGADGWSWNDVFPYFRRAEDHADGADEFHGVGGPLHVERIPQDHRHPLASAFVDAGVQAGHVRTEDFNRADLEGVGFNHTTTKNGRRHSAWQAYVAPLEDTPLLTVTTDALVDRVVVENGRAVGVQAVVAGTPTFFPALREVIVSAGAIGSPAILLRSGIGARQHLDELDIEVVADLPGVGENLHDHLLVSVMYASKEAVPDGRWNLLEAQLFARSSVCTGPAPDLQPLFIHMPYPTDGGAAPAQGYTIVAGLVRPFSRGNIRLASADPRVAALVDPKIFADERDLEAMVDAIEISRLVGAQDAFAPYRAEEFAPGPHVTDRDSLREFARRTVGTYHHQVGTCRMGTDAQSVVDPQLRVRGVAGLRVADASVMPFVPSANTNAPAIMIGEKAADLLLGATAAVADALAAR